MFFLGPTPILSKFWSDLDKDGLLNAQCSVLNTYIDIYIDVWGQASQGIHIDVVITELWGWRPGGCASCGGGSWG